ncbi:methyltransferase domain-containing protein [Streptacidiphilus sp. NEAU-YB345]|uniref:Protein-L-isoaspartate O-methyltransferase n=1 Tax=Streptacidiphilus fuscans TaxID=2789292 RepID=A0A931B0T4_9ACTN|nr:methyltransferase domain-containing protein [Streptacidiphilus fuscans]
MGRFLLNAGVLTEDWSDIFQAVPRALFLPPLFWSHDMATGQSTAVDRVKDPNAWMREAHANVPLVTQWDDGKHRGMKAGSVPTSSASMPSVVASMLRDLNVESGMRVLEIGTGTGWNAALLCQRLGSANVVSVEIDPGVATAARLALSAAGYDPELICADGRDGWVSGAPYDRIIATAGVRQIPPTWLDQTRTGGIILAPWGTDYAPQDAVLRLVKAEDGSASGRFTDFVEFMKIRAQRLAWPRHEEYVPNFPGDAERSTTPLSVAELGGKFDTAQFVTGLCIPNCTHLVHRQDDGTTVAWFYSLNDHSWAATVFRSDAATGEVYQSGNRRLWNEVEHALSWWHSLGTPEVSRFGVTVDHTGQQVWFDAPENSLRAALLA